MSVPSTIYAFATPPGKSGVAVLRISGPLAAHALAVLGVALPPARQATLVRLKYANGEVLDDALCLYFSAPNSFTGEEVVELQVHGSLAVRKALLAQCEEMPALRAAEAGEFSRRALLNGKMNLQQAEGLADLLAADTAMQARQAMQQYHGENAARFDDLRARVMRPLALLEAYIDFPDEEIPEETLAQVHAQVAGMVEMLQALLAAPPVGERVREGLEIVILGAPNVGKSSLLNCLAGKDAAIVSPMAGTTRDVVEVQLDMGGYAVTLADTAGLRETDEIIEQEGIKRALARAKHADLLLRLVSVTDAELSSQKLEENEILVVTKCDVRAGVVPAHAVAISAHTGEGIDALIEKINHKIELLVGASEGAPLITRARHRESLTRAYQALKMFHVKHGLELACEELRIAATAIGNITGKIYNDDLLDIVFREFCIGK
jgi:tRNA modification GTPase